MIKRKSMKIFVSGTYDILHAGHVQFFKEAKEFGLKHASASTKKVDLIVSICSAKNLLVYKKRKSSMPDDNKKVLIESIRYVDKVIFGNDDGGAWDFVPVILTEKPDYLLVTEDDKFALEKEKFCKDHGIKFAVLPKTPPTATQTCTSAIISNIKGT